MHSRGELRESNEQQLDRAVFVCEGWPSDDLIPMSVRRAGSRSPRADGMIAACIWPPIQIHAATMCTRKTLVDTEMVSTEVTVGRRRLSANK